MTAYSEDQLQESYTYTGENLTQKALTWMDVQQGRVRKTSR
jgi:hypothetical protein